MAVVVPDTIGATRIARAHLLPRDGCADACRTVACLQGKHSWGTKVAAEFGAETAGACEGRFGAGVWAEGRFHLGEPSCVRCALRWLCGGCRAIAWAMTGSLIGEDPQGFHRPRSLWKAVGTCRD